jgi:SPP1 gp7 family putative phage head morphogenesis protein
MPTANQTLADATVDTRLSLLQYEAGSVSRVLKAYEDALGSVNRELVRLAKAAEKGPLNEREQARLLSMRADLTEKIQGLKPVLEARLQQDILGAAEAEAQVVKRLLEANTPQTATVLSLDQAAVEAIVTQPIGGKVWADRLAIDLLEEHDALQASLAESVALGVSHQEAAAALGKATGIIETYKGRLVSIARTEIQRAANTAALDSYRRNADVIKGVTWLATLDSRTCLVCAPRHMQTYTFDELDEAGRPPLHPRCRCFLSPLTKSWAELGLPIKSTRFDGEPPREMDYEQWLTRQPAAKQLEVLGPSRWALWNRGELEFSQFAADNRVLTLPELQARYGVSSAAPGAP